MLASACCRSWISLRICSVGVAEDQVDRPDRQRAVAVEHGAESQGGGHAQPKERLARSDHAIAAHPCLLGDRKPRPHQFGATTQHEGAGAAGANILEPGQELAEESVEVGAGLAFRRRVRCGQRPNSQHHHKRHQHERAKTKPNPPVHDQDEGNHSQHQRPVAEDVDHEAREEPGQRGNVAIDPLDQLTGGVCRVEGRIEPQQVFGEVGPQRIRRGPGDVLGDICLRDRHALRHHGQDHRQHREENERLHRIAGNGPVDELARDQRRRHLRRDRGAQDQHQQDYPPAVRAQIGAQEPPGSVAERRVRFRYRYQGRHHEGFSPGNRQHDKRPVENATGEDRMRNLEEKTVVLGALP
jgi:hypothetical protein